VAALLATFPFSWLLTRYGARWIFFASGLASAAATALIPIASDLGLLPFIGARVVQGLAYACDFAVIGVCCTRWASLRENAKFISCLTCFSALASAFTNGISGVVGSRLKISVIAFEPEIFHNHRSATLRWAGPGCTTVTGPWAPSFSSHGSSPTRTTPSSHGGSPPRSSVRFTRTRRRRTYTGNHSYHIGYDNPRTLIVFRNYALPSNLSLTHLSWTSPSHLCQLRLVP
jgi:MFS family permease